MIALGMHLLGKHLGRVGIETNLKAHRAWGSVMQRAMVVINLVIVLVFRIISLLKGKRCQLFLENTLEKFGENNDWKTICGTHIMSSFERTEVGVEWPFRNIIPSIMHNPVRFFYEMTFNLRLRMILVGITNHRNP
jgi:hypothetical protein